MSFLKRIKALYNGAEKVISNVKQFKKDPLMWAGIAGFSSVLACTYGELPIECSNGERLCVDNYAALCYSEGYGYEGFWAAVECATGCDDETKRCIDNKVVGTEVTDCKTNEHRCHENKAQVCIDGIWFATNNQSFYNNGRCQIPESVSPEEGSNPSEDDEQSGN